MDGIILAASGVGRALEHPGQCRAQGFQLIDLLLLAVDQRVQFVQQIFLTGNLDLDIYQTVFGVHCGLLHYLTAVMVAHPLPDSAGWRRKCATDLIRYPTR